MNDSSKGKIANLNKKYFKLLDLAGDLLEFIYPLRCVSCKKYIMEHSKLKLGIFCEICGDTVEERGENFCPMCGTRHYGKTGESKCGDCVKNPKPFDRTIYRFIYGGAISDSIAAFKYDHNLFAGRRLTLESINLLYKEILELKLDFIVPVPIHFLKIFMRGFSPTAYIADLISNILSIPVRYNILKKVKYTRAQVGLKREERLRNIRGSFAIQDNYRKELEDKKILLVDDVFTTGTTASLCAELLKDKGARSVDLFVLARGE
ncbi:MAG: ComF family protein [Deltaproteobacteria bacterium]|nr:ComF family protein [Deltaproteobacteria bacterium]